MEFNASFNDYALEKLSLMQSLKLSDDDSIHYLIDGIKNPAIRSAAAVVRANSLDHFLEEMHKVTLSFGNPFKKEFSYPRSDKVRNSSGDSSPKGDKSDKDQKDQKENYCVYCRIRGHNRTNCFKLKRKEKLQQSSSSSSSPVATIHPISSTSSDENSNAEASTVAVVTEMQTHRRLNVKSSILKVFSLNNKPCALLALLDTGSFVSFISLSVYNKINDRPNSLIKPPVSYHSISGDKINILGSFKTKICLESLPYLKGNITLNILQKEIEHTDLILGRDFISENDIMMIYYPTNKKIDEKILLFNEMVFAVITEDTQTSDLSVLRY